MVLRRTLVIICAMFWAVYCQGQGIALSGRVELVSSSGSIAKNASDVVVWLTPANASATPTRAVQLHPRLVQTGKHFEPHLLVVPVGTAVEFPNQDPFFHNVFSLFEGKRFDLGLYESGSSRMVHFDKPGISYIFCNIHPQMSAVVIALSTPYYAISNFRGEIVIPNVPPGRYGLTVWSEGSLPEELKRLTREIVVSEAGHSLGIIRVRDSGSLQIGHKNKYGKDYDDPTPTTPGYAR